MYALNVFNIYIYMNMISDLFDGLATWKQWLRRVSAQCWLVDEDCIFGAVPGRKRQGASVAVVQLQLNGDLYWSELVKIYLESGIIFGALAMTQNFAGAEHQWKLGLGGWNGWNGTTYGLGWGALFSSMTFLGLGLAGLETVNCEVGFQAVGDDVVTVMLLGRLGGTV